MKTPLLQRRKFHGLRRRVIQIALAVLAVLLLFVLGFSLYIYRLNDRANDRYNQNETDSIAAFVYSQQLAILDTLITISGDSYVSVLSSLEQMGARQYSGQYIDRLINLLNGIMKSNQDIYSLQLMLPSANLVVGTEGTGGIDTFLKANKAEGLLDALYSYDSAKSLLIANGMTRSMYYMDSLEVRYHLYRPNARHAALLIISSNNLNRKLANQFADKNMAVYLLNEYDQLYGWYVPSGDPLSALQAAALYEDQARASTTHNGESVDVYRAKAGQIRIVALFGRGALSAALLGNIWFSGIMVGLLALLSAYLYFTLTRSFSRPVEDILKKYAAGSAEAHGNEFTQLDRMMGDMLLSISSMEQRIRETEIAVQREARDVIKNIAPDDHSPDLAAPGLPFALYSLVIEDEEGVFQRSLCHKVGDAIARRWRARLISSTQIYTAVIAVPEGCLPLDELERLIGDHVPGHFFCRMSVSDLHTDWKHLWVAYDECQTVLDMSVESRRVTAYQAWMSQAKRRFCVELGQQTRLASRVAGGDAQEVMRCLDDIYGANASLNRHWQCRLSGYLLDLLVVLSSNRRASDPIVINPEAPWVTSYNPALLKSRVYEYFDKLTLSYSLQDDSIGAKILDFVDNHLAEDMTLMDVAEYVNRSYSYVSTRFHDLMGSTFTVYLQKRRIERAIALLTESSRPVSEIAEMVGYGATSSFIRTFKNETGMTPGQYREKHKSNREGNL